MIYNYIGDVMLNEFKSLKELYDRITPALISKEDEFKKVGYNHIKRSDIWNYLTQTKWTISISLTLSDMVNDVFNASALEISKYVMKEEREPNFDE